MIFFSKSFYFQALGLGQKCGFFGQKKVDILVANPVEHFISRLFSQ